MIHSAKPLEQERLQLAPSAYQADRPGEVQRRSVHRPPGQPIAKFLPGTRFGIGIHDGAEQERDGHVGERLDGRVDQGPQVVAVAPGRGQARVVSRVEVEPASPAGRGIEQDVAERRVAVAQAFALPVGRGRFTRCRSPSARLAAPRPRNRCGAGSSRLRA